MKCNMSVSHIHSYDISLTSICFSFFFLIKQRNTTDLCFLSYILDITNKRQVKLKQSEWPFYTP